MRAQEGQESLTRLWLSYVCKKPTRRRLVDGEFACPRGGLKVAVVWVGRELSRRQARQCRARGGILPPL